MSREAAPNGKPDRAPGLLGERQRVVLSLFASADRPLSTTEISGLVGQTLGATAHHVRALARGGYLQWSSERRVRGALQTFYTVSDAGRAALRHPRVGAFIELTGMLGELPRPGERLPTMPSLDEQAIEELERLIDEVRPRMLDIGRRWLHRARGDDLPW